MKLSRNWLSEYVDLADIDDVALEEALTMIGFEVEDVESTGLAFTENIVVGEVRTTGQHPNADRLSVNEVDVGDGTARHIVCGAKNFKVGDRVFVALPGARVKGGDGEAFKIKKSKLRGEPSEGMMCSARELGLGDDHAGLMILEDRPEIGTPIDAVLTENDTIFHIEVTPNRPDCLSHIGIARELAARFGKELEYPRVNVSDRMDTVGEPVVNKITVEAEEPCPLYYGFSIRGVTIGPSPDWLKQAIKAVGLRPVNNVVDVTNYVLMELGQPLHAFDAAKIGGGSLVIRQARPGEMITTLDDRKRELNPNMTVIADSSRPLVIAGVMGSLDAEVDDSTRDILLEAAYFRASFIRWTSRKLGLSTDSSYRFERGVDPENVEFAALRAIDLILEVAGGTLVGPPLVVGSPPILKREIELRPEFIREVAGYGPDNRAIEAALQSLELDVRIHGEPGIDETWLVGIPSFRRDLERPIDLAEEFIRIYGTDQIPDIDVQTRAHVFKTDPVAEFFRGSSAYLIGRQFNECMSYSLRPEPEVRAWYGQTVADTLGLHNPMTTDQSHLRPSLLPGLLDTLKLNLARGTGMSRLFERGRVFRESRGQVFETISVAFLLYREPEASGWLQREAPDFYLSKSILSGILGFVGLRADAAAPVPLEGDETWQAGHSARLGHFEDDGWEAQLGLLNPMRTKNWDIKGLVFAGSLILKPELLAEASGIVRYRPVSMYPPVSKDLALVVDTGELAGTVRGRLEAAARQAAADRFEVEAVEVFDVYTGEGLPEGKKSLAFSMVFRSRERTLNDAEVNTAFEAIQKEISAEAGYTVRN